MRIFILIYVFAAAILSFASVLTDSYPARFWIDLFAPNPGDKFPVGITGFLTMLSMLIPLIILLFILKLLRNRKKATPDSLIDDDYFNKSGIHLMRRKQMQNRLIASPIFINGEQRSQIDSGKTAFVELQPGTYEVEVGRKGDKSEILIVQVQANTHTQVEIQIIPNGIRSKHVIEVI